MIFHTSMDFFTWFSPQEPCTSLCYSSVGTLIIPLPSKHFSLTILLLIFKPMMHKTMTQFPTCCQKKERLVGFSTKKEKTVIQLILNLLVEDRYFKFDNYFSKKICKYFSIVFTLKYIFWVKCYIYAKAEVCKVYHVYL